MGNTGDRYQERATSFPSTAPITPYTLTSELFLPAHLRLGQHNWLEFKLAIETVLRVKGIPVEHLRGQVGREARRTLSGEEGKQQREKWLADDELCKAIIVLNVRSEHLRFAAYALEQWPAEEMWTALMIRDREIRGRAQDKWVWLEKVYTGLFCVACVVLCLMVQQLWWVYTGRNRAPLHSPASVMFGPE